MMTSHRRIALLTGASLAALGTAAPAFAAPNYPAASPHDAVANGTLAGAGDSYFGSGTVTDTLDICNIATTIDCFLGVKEAGAGNQTATVNSSPTGQLNQNAAGPLGSTTFNVVTGTGDVAEIGAVASATGGVVTADANLYTAISQYITNG